MTRFERDLQAAKAGDEKEVIIRRRAELAKLITEGKTCKNSFRMKCIAQDVAKLRAELAIIEDLF